MKTKSDASDSVVMPSDIQEAECMWIAGVQSLLQMTQSSPAGDKNLVCSLLHTICGDVGKIEKSKLSL